MHLHGVRNESKIEVNSSDLLEPIYSGVAIIPRIKQSGGRPVLQGGQRSV